jgi:DNA-binding NtrC family response regulator
VNVLLTFTGYHDPFAASGSEGDSQAGPVLTVVAERRFDRVYLFATPRTAEISEQTAAEISKRSPTTTVKILEVPLKDPTNYLGILRQLRGHFRSLNAKHPDASYSICVSSGTPHMHACWLLLAASGEIPAGILQSVRPEFARADGSQVREIDIHQQSFPAVALPEPGGETVGDDEEEIRQACVELGIVGDDPAFARALSEAYTYAQYDDVHLLLLGETGTGKEYFANFIYRMGRRSSRPLVTVNCSAIPENLVESQLFGHKKGSFTGATSDQPGKFKAAEGGTIFLDELGELPLPAQAKLLRVLEQGEIEPVGAAKPVKVGVRVVAATNCNLQEMVRDGTFRSDLYQRFGATITIPPLRRRQADIPKLALHILGAWNAKHQKQKKLAAQALTALTRHHWPGNVRELRRVVTQSAMLSPKAVIGVDALRFELPLSPDPLAALPEPKEGFQLGGFLDEVKQALISRALEKSGGVQAKAARLLGLTPQAINQFLKSRWSSTK